MATVKLRSRENILGDLIRSVLINTDITAINRGSDIATILEAISESLFQVEITSLKILESINLESLVGTALDKKAESIKIPNGQGGFGRKPATQGSGTARVGSGFDKISSKLYAGKPAPFAGGTTLFLEDAQEFPATGFIYIARGTVDRFEGPLAYSSVVNNGSFWTMTLTQPLTKSHLQSDLVTFAQGGERTVEAGTTVQIPANSESPPVNFVTTKAITIADGEAESDVPVVCSQFGEVGNALAGAITQFSGSPFAGATVTNPTSFNNGKSTESDEDLRQRIKNYPATLSRGTRGAILGAILGATDPDSGRSVTSAVVLEPVEPGDVARVYIDDGTGLEPTFGNQAAETLLKKSSGQETRFRTAQFPITAALIEGAESAPFALEPSMTLTIKVDEVVETYSIDTDNYQNISSASAYEIVRDLNFQSNIVGFRTIDGGSRIVAIDLSGEAETIQVFSGDWQEAIGLPTAILRPIFLYEDSELLSFRGKTATLTTIPRNSWVLTAADLQDVRIAVDGVIQTISITDSDFAEFQSTIQTATIAEWATVFSRKIAGVKFTTQGQVLVWSTWQDLSVSGTLEILETKEDGSPAGWIGDDKIWQPVTSGGVLSDYGANKDFDFNRFTGEITLLDKPTAGDEIEVASRSTRAHIRSTVSATGLFSLDPLPTLGNAKVILGFDGVFDLRDPTVIPGLTFTPTQPDPTGASNVLRLTASDPQLLQGVEVGDWLYLVPDASVGSPLPADTEALYRIISHGAQTTATDVVYNGLLGATQTFASLSFFTEADSNQIKVSQLNHGLRTGDLVTTVETGSNVGGLTPAQISQTDAVITVLNPNEYLYTAGATATSTSSGLLDTLGHNLITVTHASHGFVDGAYTDVSVTTGFGGIGSGDLTVTDTPLQIVDLNSYIYRATAAATTTETSQTVNSVTIKADTWIEFETSLDQFTTWTPLLNSAQSVTLGMFNVFASSVIPQVVDFGTVSSLTVDQVVDSINDQIASGVAEKVSPQQLEIRTSSFNESGTCAVLSSIGNAESMFSAAAAESQQAHIAASPTSDVQGAFPVVEDIELPTVAASGYATRTYLKLQRNMTEVLDEAAPNPTIQTPATYQSEYPVGFQHVWLTGRASPYSARVYNNQTTAPYTGVLTGADIIAPPNTFDNEQTSLDTLDRYANFGLRLQDVPLNNYDSIVAELDLDPTDKTVAVPMSKLAKIQDIDTLAGTGKGQVISFRLKDPEDSDRPFFDTSSVYQDFDFTDFKMLTKSVGLYREDVSDRALIVRSADYGAPHKLRFSVRLPSEPDLADIAITHTNDYLDDKPRLNLIATLPSDALTTGSTLGSGQYKVTSIADSNIFEWRFSAPTLNNTSVYAVGDVLNVGGNSNIAGSYYISASNYTDAALAPATTTAGSNVITVTVAGHGFETGDLITTQASSSIGGIPASALAVVGVPVTVINPNTFTYVANYSVLSALAVSASTDGTTSTVTCTLVGHGLSSGNLIAVTATSAIGGIAAVDLSTAGTAVTVIDANTFTYVAASASTSAASGTLDSISNPINDSGSLDTVRGGSVTVKAPGSGGLAAGVTFDAAQNPVRSWALLDKTLEDMADAINDYFPSSPVATAEAIGTDFALNPMSLPTYMVYDAGTPYVGTDMSGAFTLHSFETHYAGSAGIWQYDSSVPTANGIKATVQTDESIFPLASEATGTLYQPIDEEVMLVPTNTKTIASWMEFRAVSSLNLLTSVERFADDGKIQLSSREDGSDGAVRITGVTANSLETFVVGNATNVDSSTKLVTLRSNSRALLKGQLVKVTNSVAADIRRSYRDVPEGLSETPANTTEINTYFRPTNAIKYVRVNTSTGRLIFLRNGKGPSQTEPLDVGNNITLTSLWPGLGPGLVQVTGAQAAGGAGTGELSARVGDMMYIQRGGPFDPDAECELLPTSGVTDGDEPEYLGYPVVHVIDDNNVIVIAPNITTFGTTALTAAEDLVFLPAVWNEKNIRTNHAEGAKFRQTVNNNEAHYLVKSLGQGVVSVWLQNSSTEATDDMLLESLSVSTDDWAVFGDGFDPANQGTFRIIAHNGRNHLIVYNPNGGKDELIDPNATSNGGAGQRKWRVGPLNDGIGRSLRILDADSVRIGDLLRISTPTDSAQWFNDVFIGSWEITKIGYTALDFSGDALPHDANDGTYDQAYIAPYIDFAMPNAPEAVLDSTNNPVDSFLVGNNDASIGFTEGEFFETFRVVSGHGVNPQSEENGDVFLEPQRSTSKMSNTFGTKLTAWNKLGFEERTFQGIDGYKIYTGLVQQTHRIIDGLPDNTVLFPGVKAAGAVVEVLTPLIKSIQVDLQVRPKDGITLNSITDVVKATVASYVNGLGVGSPVVLSEIIRAVQTLPGVFSVEILSTTPTAEDDRIVVSDIEKPFILDITTDVTVG